MIRRVCRLTLPLLLNQANTARHTRPIHWTLLHILQTYIICPNLAGALFISSKLQFTFCPFHLFISMYTHTHTRKLSLILLYTYIKSAGAYRVSARLLLSPLTHRDAHLKQTLISIPTHNPRLSRTHRTHTHMQACKHPDKCLPTQRNCLHLALPSLQVVFVREQLTTMSQFYWTTLYIFKQCILKSPACHKTHVLRLLYTLIGQRCSVIVLDNVWVTKNILLFWHVDFCFLFEEKYCNKHCTVDFTKILPYGEVLTSIHPELHKIKYKPTRLGLRGFCMKDSNEKKYAVAIENIETFHCCFMLPASIFLHLVIHQ